MLGLAILAVVGILVFLLIFPIRGGVVGDAPAIGLSAIFVIIYYAIFGPSSDVFTYIAAAIVSLTVILFVVRKTMQG